jgi:mono/diheme cytochrome c family protein
MRSSLAGPILCALAWCVYGCAFQLGESSLAEEPRALYLNACASCHGTSGVGDGPVGAALRTPPPDLTRLAQRHAGVFPRTLVIAVITGEHTVVAHGTREMPVWSQCFRPTTGATGAAAFYVRRRLELIADYLESIQVRGGQDPGRVNSQPADEPQP